MNILNHYWLVGKANIYCRNIIGEKYFLKKYYEYLPLLNHKAQGKQPVGKTKMSETEDHKFSWRSSLVRFLKCHNNAVTRLRICWKAKTEMTSLAFPTISPVLLSPRPS